MAVNENFKCWFGNMVETSRCATMYETFDISNDECTTGGGIPFPDDTDNAGIASSWYLAGFCTYTEYYYFCQNNPNDSACTGAPPPVTLGCPSGYHDDLVEYETLYGGPCTDSLCCVPDQTTADLYGEIGAYETEYGVPQEVESYGGQLEQGLIEPRWVNAGDPDQAVPGPILMRVLMENYSNIGLVFSSNGGTPIQNIYDQATYLYGLTRFWDDATAPMGASSLELPDPFIVTNWDTQIDSLTYKDHGNYINIELNYLADVLGYDHYAASVTDLSREINKKIEDLILLIGTSEIANQILNNVVDYGKIRASQVTTISQQEASQTISIGKGDTSAY